VRRLNYSRPARVARVSGKRVGDKGRPRLRREREERKRDVDIERSWNLSGWQLPNKGTLSVADNFPLTAIPKTAQKVLAVGDWLKFESNKGGLEIMLISKIKTSKGVTTYFVERAIHRTKMSTWDSTATIYINK
tara:strand:+ start:5482 stop:5883 length:402 start_codon:yes stop_codon:yes gene_type:complete